MRTVVVQRSRNLVVASHVHARDINAIMNLCGLIPSQLVTFLVVSRDFRNQFAPSVQEDVD